MMWGWLLGIGLVWLLTLVVAWALCVSSKAIETDFPEEE